MKPAVTGAEISRQFASHLAAWAAPADSPATTVGIESEFAVRESDTTVDFATLLASVAAVSDPPVVREEDWDYHVAGGVRVYADQGFAEVATPPLPLTGSSTQPLVDAAATAGRWLRQALAQYGAIAERRYTIEGVSMHVNVGVGADVDGWEVARTVTRTYGPLLLFLSAVPQSLGIIVRPRPGRIELVTEYVGHASRVRALVACLSAAVRIAAGSTPPSVPALTACRLKPAPTRYGYHLLADAIGPEFRTQGRHAPTRLGEGVTFQAYLEACWRELQPLLRELPADSKLVRAYIKGTRTTPFESTAPARGGLLPCRREAHRAGARSPLAAALETRQIGGWTLRPRLMDWRFVVFEARAEESAAFVTLPQAYLSGLADGAYDEMLPSVLTSFRDATTAPPASASGEAPGALALTHLAQTEAPGLFTSLDRDSLSSELERIPGVKKHRERGCQVQKDEEGNIEICQPPVFDPQSLAFPPWEPPQRDTRVGYNIWVHNGSFGEQSLDLQVRSLGFDFKFVRYSRSAVDYDGPVGLGWDHGYNIRIIAPRPAEAGSGFGCEYFPGPLAPVTYYHGNGRYTRHAAERSEQRIVHWGEGDYDALVTLYAQNPGEEFEIQRYAVLKVLHGTLPEGLTEPIFYRIRVRGGTKLFFNCHGYVVAIRDRHRNRMRFKYEGPVNPLTNYNTLSEIRDTLDRQYLLAYQPIAGVPRLQVLVLMMPEPNTGAPMPTRIVTYHYDQIAQLTSVSLVAGAAGTPEITYAYEPGVPGLLKSAVRPSHAASREPFFENTYDGRRVTQQRVGQRPAGGWPAPGEPSVGGEYVLRYPASGTVVVVDRTKVEWTYTIADDRVKKLSVKDTVWTGTQPEQIELTTEYEYDANYHYQSITHPSGAVESFEYEPFNLPVLAGDELDRLAPGMPIAYDRDLRRDDCKSHTIHERGGTATLVTSYEHEFLFNALTKITAPTADETVLVYDHGHWALPQRNGNPVKIIHPKQRRPDGSSADAIETFEYGRGGVQISLTDPDNVTSVWTHHETGQVQTHTVGGRSRESHTYDLLGRRLTTTDARGGVWRYTQYDSRDNLIQYSDPLNHGFGLAYDLDDRMTMRTYLVGDDPDPHQQIGPLTPAVRVVIEQTAFDLVGNRTSFSEVVTTLNPPSAEARVSTWKYDAEQRLIGEDSPRATAGVRADARTSCGFNARGLLAWRITGAGGAQALRAELWYDKDGRLARQQSQGAIESYTYDGYGRPKVDTLATGAEIHREYAGATLKREWRVGSIETAPAGLGGTTLTNKILSETAYEFDAARRVVRRSEMIFDPAQRGDIQPAVTASAAIEVWYSAAGRPWKRVDPGGRTTVQTYDGSGQLDLVTLPSGDTIQYGWSGPDRETVTIAHKPQPGVGTTPAPPPITLVERTERDKLGRVTRRVSHGVTLYFAHDSLGNVRAQLTPLSLTTMEYDAFSNPVKRTTDHLDAAFIPGGRIVQEFRYDQNGNRTDAWDAAGGHSQWRYDSHDRIEWSREPGLPEATAIYAASGRLERQSFGGRQIRYAHDAVGQVTKIETTEGGRTLTQTFGYDGAERMTWALDDNASPPRGLVLVRREHDSLGRVVRETSKVPDHAFEQSVGHAFTTAPDTRTITYPPVQSSGAAMPVVYHFGSDGNVHQIDKAGAPLLTRVHQGPQRPLQTTFPVAVDVVQPLSQESIDVILSDRPDAYARPANRSLWIRDRAVLGTSAAPQLNELAHIERIEYSPAHGLPQLRTVTMWDFPNPAGYINTRFEYDGVTRLAKSTDERLTGGATEIVARTNSWDGVNRLRQVKEERTDTGGATTTELITTQWHPGKRIDRKPSETSTSSWDDRRRYTSIGAGSSDRRELKYDPAGRPVYVQRWAPGSYYRNTTTLYDALGRLAYREVGDGNDVLDRLFYLYDGPRCITEIGGRWKRYVYDEAGLLVNCEYAGHDVIPVVNFEGTPWLLLNRKLRVASRPSTTPVLPRQFYLLDAGLLLEEREWNPFGEGKIRAWVGGTAAPSGTQVHIGNGGRLFLPEENLLYTQLRFYDPQTGEFLTPDPGGVWADPQSLGNPRTQSGNNPAAFADDGGIAWFVLLRVLLWSAAVGVGFDLARQVIQRLEGSRSEFSGMELVEAAFAGAVVGAAVYMYPPLALPLLEIGVANSIYQYAVGDIGKATLAFDLAVALYALPKAFRHTTLYFQIREANAYLRTRGAELDALLEPLGKGKLRHQFTWGVGVRWEGGRLSKYIALNRGAYRKRLPATRYATPSLEPIEGEFYERPISLRALFDQGLLRPDETLLLTSCMDQKGSVHAERMLMWHFNDGWIGIGASRPICGHCAGGLWRFKIPAMTPLQSIIDTPVPEIVASGRFRGLYYTDDPGGFMFQFLQGYGFSREYLWWSRISEADLLAWRRHVYPWYCD